jgi:hypothetical protein
MKIIKKFAFLVILAALPAGCSQNMEVANTGERLEDSPKPTVDPNAAPLARPDAPKAVEEEEREVPPFVKAFFMHTWVEALYSTPKNKNPNPKWQSPLKDPVDGRVWCTDCHISGQVDFSRIPKMRLPIVEEFENDKEFMVGLMKKWVGRLNSDEYFAKAKLKGPVTCLTCHATNPAE